MHTFLIGGGRDEAGGIASHAPFVAAASARHGHAPILVLVLDEGQDTDVPRWTSALARAGAAATRPLVVSAERPPQPEDVAGAAGVFVAGGLTPGYRDALAGRDRRWLDAVLHADLPYAGFSAGAAIAAQRALVGGWRAPLGGVEIMVCDDGAGEDLDTVTLAEGLGLVPLTVDVHCAQWGTLTRLVHAVRAEPSLTGCGIDEHTTVEVHGGELRVHGAGAAYLLRPTDAGEHAVAVLGPGSTTRLA